MSGKGARRAPPRFRHPDRLKVTAGGSNTGRAPMLRTLALATIVGFAAQRGARASADAAAAAEAREARRRELLDLARADLRRRHLRPHQRRDALLFGDRGARRLAAGREGESRARRVRSRCGEAAPASRDQRRLAGRSRRRRCLRHDADRSREALSGAPRPAGSRHGRSADHRGAQRSGEDAHPPARGLARPAARHGLHLRPALRGGEHSGRGRRGGRGRQGDAALRHGGRQGRSPVADAHHADHAR